MALNLTQYLNPAQLRAATAPDGAVLVIAAAGTGKTRTLTHRVAWLVRERQIEPRNILLLTFTNRAANEMLERASQLIGRDAARPWGGTFHHTANRMLRRHAGLLGYGPDYTILDEDDSEKLLKVCTAELGLTDKLFPKPSVLSSLFGLAASRRQVLMDTVSADFRQHAPRLEGVLRVHERYQARKRQLNAMDFDDLLVNGLRLLEEHAEVADAYSERMRHVLVDEYQDTNALQCDFVDRLTARHGNLLAVGDDFQSIYSWRGAEVRNILSFEQRHPGALVVKLEENYRSRPEILEVANQVIAGNPEQYQKVLRATRPAEVKPVKVELPNGNSQASYIIDKVRHLLAHGVAKPREIAVLYRSHFQALELQLELARASLPYELMSGVRFFEQAHIKDVCALARLVVNAADRLAFGRLVELLPKVGPKRAENVWLALGERFNLRDAESRQLVLDKLPAPARAPWARIMAGLFPEEDERENLLERPDEVVFRFVEAFYKEHAELTYDNAANRLEDIEELIRFSARYASTAEFLAEMALLTNLDTNQMSRAGERAEQIRLSTVHQAKGLEWKAVFVLWLNEGMFPAARTLSESEDDSEERRLFYVAVTRAKDYLWLCVPRGRRARDGNYQFLSPSRFMDEIDGDLLQHEHIRSPSGWGPRGMRW
ncbi:MAG: ATP-dependent helicase [Lentisphaerae bacterium]|jgi:DNA helicase-2/ATP-dependent DNA helicase PcrA|nr:ATP-dependent helicase [Lentisphaerota bacterium]